MVEYEYITFDDIEYEIVKLKPCPFCGGNAKIEFSGDHYRGGYIIARCQTCGAASKGCYYRGPEIETPLEITTGGEKTGYAWNRRV